jgi:hypothetical protein
MADGKATTAVGVLPECLRQALLINDDVLPYTYVACQGVPAS